MSENIIILHFVKAHIKMEDGEMYLSSVTYSIKEDYYIFSNTNGDTWIIPKNKIVYIHTKEIKEVDENE